MGPKSLPVWSPRARGRSTSRGRHRCGSAGTNQPQSNGHESLSRYSPLESLWYGRVCIAIGSSVRSRAEVGWCGEWRCVPPRAAPRERVGRRARCAPRPGGARAGARGHTHTPHALSALCDCVHEHDFHFVLACLLVCAPTYAWSIAAPQLFGVFRSRSWLRCAAVDASPLRPSCRPGSAGPAGACASPSNGSPRASHRTASCSRPSRRSSSCPAG